MDESRHECIVCKGSGSWVECRRSRKNRDFIKRHVCLMCNGKGYFELGGTVDRPFRTNERVQVLFDDGRRFSWPTTVEQIRKNYAGQLVGYVYYNQFEWRVRQLACGEWIGVDANNQRCDISDRALQEHLEAENDR